MEHGGEVHAGGALAEDDVGVGAGLAFQHREKNFLLRPHGMLQLHISKHTNGLPSESFYRLLRAGVALAVTAFIGTERKARVLAARSGAVVPSNKHLLQSFEMSYEVGPLSSAAAIAAAADAF